MFNKFLFGLLLISYSLVTYSAPKMKGPNHEMPTVVETAPVQKQSIQTTLQSTGTLLASDNVTISSEISGRIAKVYFKSGQDIKAKERLIELDSSILRAQLKKAEAQLELHKLNYDRLLKLYKKNFYNKADLDQAKMTVTTSQADVDILKAQLDQTVITAPCDGRLGLSQVSEGEFLVAGKAIVDLEVLDPLYVEFNLPEQNLSQIHVGDPVTIIVKALGEKIYKGSINLINPKIDPASRLLMVRATISNTNQLLLPGLFVEVNVLVGAKKSILTIPQLSIVYEANGTYVYRLIGHKAVKTAVELGESLAHDQIEVKKGLDEHDVVIIGGTLLSDQAHVITRQEATQQQSSHHSLNKVI